MAECRKPDKKMNNITKEFCFSFMPSACYEYNRIGRHLCTTVRWAK